MRYKSNEELRAEAKAWRRQAIQAGMLFIGTNIAWAAAVTAAFLWWID